MFRTAGLIEIWERGVNRPPYARALLMLAFAFPDLPVETLAGWSLGRRDASLLALRENLFGDRLSATANCPGCGERIEMNFRTSDIRAPHAEMAAGRGTPVVERQVTLPGGSAHGPEPVFRIRLRPLTSQDLIEMAQGYSTGKNGESARQVRPELVFRRLVISAERESGPVLAEDLPDEVFAGCAQALAEIDPQADIQLALRCPNCGHAWEAPFDIVSYLWQEIETGVGRMLREVHLLASAYGWSEGEILRLSPLRRRRYLEMVVG